MHIPDDQTCQCTGCELVRRGDRITAIEVELAECRAQCQELANHYVGDLGQEVLKLGRENDHLRKALEDALTAFRWIAPYPMEAVDSNASEIAWEAGNEIKRLLKEKGGET